MTYEKASPKRLAFFFVSVTITVTIAERVVLKAGIVTLM